MSQLERIMLAAGAASALGIVIAASGQGLAGGMITVGGWVTLVFSIHRYGRSGA